MNTNIQLFVAIVICLPNSSLLLIIPEDVATGFAAIYGFAPPIHKGNDHRIGFGFRFGNHADFQILYEIGPQIVTKPLQTVTRTRSTTYRQAVQRRPFLEFLLKAGLFKRISVSYDDDDDDDDDDQEPR